MTFDYLTSEDIIDLHTVGMQRYGGKVYSFDQHCVEAKSFLPQSGFGDTERYEGLFLKAAVYMYYLITSHCFSDGNKRVGFLAADTFLNLNGYVLKVDEDELFRFCLKIADKDTRPPLDEVEHWIKKHAVPFEY